MYKSSFSRAGEAVKEKLNTVIFPSEAVVIDSHVRQIVTCPTEDEAVEYIREQEGSESNEDKKG